jgi:hypothetical protein
MAERDFWDLLQPTWVDRMGATAWDPPSMPLFEGTPWPNQPDSASANGAGQPNSFSGSSDDPSPLPPEWPQYVPGPAAPQSMPDPETWAHILNALLSRPRPARNFSTADAATSDIASPVANSSADRGSESSGAAPPPYRASSNEPSNFELAQAAQPPADSGPRPPARTQPRSQFAYPGYPIGISDDPGASGGSSFENNWPDPSAFGSGPAWLRDSMAVPPSPRPASPPNMDFLMQRLKEKGFDANDFVDRFIYAESSGNTYAKAEGSTGLGAGRFTDPTWKDQLWRYRPGLITENPWLAPSIQQRPRTIANKDNSKSVEASGIMNMRSNYALAREMTANYANQLAKQLDANGFEVTPGNIYLMYVAGPGDGRKLMEAIKKDRNAPALSIVPKVVRKNDGIAGSNPTVEQLQAGFAKKIMEARPDLLPFSRSRR